MVYVLANKILDQTNKDNSETSNDEEEEEDDDKSKEGEGFQLKKEKPSLATILSSAPPKFPWLFPQKNKKEESSEPKEGLVSKFLFWKFYLLVLL